MDDESRLFLQRIYEPEIARLEELLGRRLPQLRKNWISEPAVTQAEQAEMPPRWTGLDRPAVLSVCSPSPI